MKNLQAGYSIIEIVMYMGILAILLLILTDIFVSTLDVRAESQANSSVVEDGRFILARLTYDINRSQTISIPANFGDSSSSLQITIDGTTYSYSLASGTLNLQNTNGTNALNSANTTVSSLSFKKIGNNGGKASVQVTFTVTSAVLRKTGFDSRTYQTAIGTR